MSKKGARPRTQAREDERAARKLVQARERLAELAPGGAAERPVEVVSPAVIEPQVASTPCVQCGGQLRVDEHAVAMHAGEPLRVVRARCQRCGAPRERWFRVRPPRPN